MGTRRFDEIMLIQEFLKEEDTYTQEEFKEKVKYFLVMLKPYKEAVEHTVKNLEARLSKFKIDFSHNYQEDLDYYNLKLERLNNMIKQLQLKLNEQME